MRQNCFDINRRVIENVEYEQQINMQSWWEFRGKIVFEWVFFIKWSVGELAHAGTGSAE